MSKAKHKNKQKPAQVEQGPSDLQLMAGMLGKVCLLGALGIACYLAINSLRQGSLAGCGEGGGCDEVLASKWAYVFGVPVSVFGAVSYLALLISDWRGRWPLLHALVRWMILGAAVWFVCLQLLVVKHFCPWCCTTHALAVLGTLLVWPRGKSSLKRSTAPWLAPALGAGAVLGLILIQTFGPDRATTAGGSLAKGKGAKVEAPSNTGPRKVALHGGKFSIDVDEFPAIGDSKTATHVAVGLFDFTCPHCQHLIEILTDVQKQFPKDLAVVQLPGHFNAKGQAVHQQMLPLWREDRETYHAIADMMHGGGIKPTSDAVRTAISSQIDPATQQGWIVKHAAWTTQVLEQSQQIRAANKAITKSGKFPQLMIGDYVETGVKDNAGYYYKLLEEKLGLKRSAIPQLASTPMVIDLGKVMAGSSQSFQLTLSNPSQHAATIQKVRTPAGMRLVGNEPKQIAAGAEVTVPIQASVPLRAGPLSGSVIFLSDADPDSLSVEVKAMIVQPYQIDFGPPQESANASTPGPARRTPTFLDLGIFTDTPLQGKVTIRFDEPAIIGLPRSNNPKEFTPTATEVEKGKVFEIAIVGTPNKDRKGIHQGSITIPIRPVDASVPWPNNVRIPVRCRVGPVPPPRTVNPAATPRQNLPVRPNRTTPPVRTPNTSVPPKPPGLK